MQVALSITQEAFRHAKRARLLHHTVYAATNQAHTMSSTTFSPSSDSSLSRTPNFWIQSMLFPEIADCEMQQNLNAGFFGQPFFDEQLNWEQKKAVESVFLRNYGTLPFLISGPPGTGKTKTLVEIALQLINSVDQEPHVLFCAPSDPAADTIVQRISANFNPADLLRLNRPSRTFAEVPGAVLPYCYVFDNKFDLPPFKQLLSYK
jgi:superfamily I DNA and/or RNA helicase